MIRLYDDNSYLTEFCARVTACTKNDKGYEILLDKTAFFPTAGGQEHDSGILDGQKVLDVEVRGNDIIHLLEKPLEEGINVTGKINWEQRFRKMQHHTAEHIISGLVKSMYGFDNTGFHLSNTEVTMDYSGELRREDIERLENSANQAVFKNLAVTAQYPENVKNMEYRSKLDLTENVRIVTVEGVDVCACCAPHVRRTGEIGVIKITSFMRHRGGTRMRMICGTDALEDYQCKQNSVEEISCMLSEKQENVSEGVKRILNETESVKQKNSELRRKIAVLRAESIEYTDANLCLFEPETERGDMLFYAEQCRKKCGGMLTVCAGNDSSGYSYIILCRDMPDIKQMNTALNGRGGGRNGMIQGFFGCTRAEIESYFNQL